MGKYYDPEAVAKQGKRIIAGDSQPRIHAGEVLVMVLDRLIFKVAADVTQPSEYAEFYRQYASGMAVRCDVYSLPQSVADTILH